MLGRSGGYSRNYHRRKNTPGFKEMKKKSDKKYFDRLREEGVLSQRQQKYYQTYISQTKNQEIKKQRAKDYYAKTKESRRKISTAYTRRYRDKIKHKVLFHYSNGKLQCKVCEIDVYAVLSLDHINNDGSEHKKRLVKSGKASSTTIYKDLIDSNYPDGYQILCFNCDYLKEFIRRTN